MKVAIVHDYLNQRGGAERVLEVLLELFPEAHLYTLLYSQSKTGGRFQNNIHKTSLLDFDLARRYHRLFIPLMPRAIKSLDLGDRYDLILSDSAGYAKGIPHSRNTFHLSYCYTPLRYAWELENYFHNPVFKSLFRPIFRYLQKWDYKAAQGPHVMIAVSQYIAGKVRNYYGRSASVVYPPVDYRTFFYDERLQPPLALPAYFLAVGRLLHYKKFDLLIDAFQGLDRTLLIVGSGPESANIERRALKTGNVRAIPFVTDKELRSLYSGAAAFVFPQAEDFGLVAAEAQACGTPVIAFGAGGALEIVQDGVTGIFFRDQSSNGIREAVRRFEQMSFDRREIARLSRRFSVENFQRGILEQIPADILSR